ncbi:MAG: phosphotransferase [Verrucomicrobiales bacterium]|nr:phosphotransferase [Verrucomicrobiales bacterium]MCP5519866.1 phosphotransferase [Verrucomicrobiales bacterium]MCP5526819.1 phosphotransferase [Verrucomicrobiales bacterium]
MQPDEWRRAHPELFFLDPRDREGLEAYLSRCGMLARDERLVATAPAGEGNMNCVVRAQIRPTGNEAGSAQRALADRTLIVKQARPWVEKYPAFAAPWDRAIREAEFYALTATSPGIADLLPRLLHADEVHRVLVLEDLGAGTDYSFVYGEGRFTADDINRLAGWLGELHGAFAGRGEHPRLSNREMRELNSRHLFFIPLAPDNGLDLDRLAPGLRDAAAALQQDRVYVGAVHEMARVYLADGPCLLHGDVFPGSLLRTERGLRVIDPEFAFFGPPEFDVAVFLAHLRLARQPADLAQRFLERYEPHDGFDERLMCRLAGVEIMRRVIGYAQLPLAGGLPHRERLLALSRSLVLAPNRAPLLND